MVSVRFAPWAARSQPKSTAKAEESAASTLERSITVAPPRTALSPSVIREAADWMVMGPDTCSRSPFTAIMTKSLFVRHRGFAALVLGLKSLDEAVDTRLADFLGEFAAVIGHQADAADGDVVDLPALVRFL